VPDAATLHRLRSAKLTALVREHGLTVGSEVDAGDFPGGAAVVLDHEGVPGAWVLADEAVGPVLGAALAWALRRDARSLDLVVGEALDAGTLARRARAFDLPVRVWQTQGRTLLAATPTPLPEPPPVPEHHLSFRALMVAAGARPNIEFGVLTGEVDGLEVCRVVDDPHTGATRLEVGIGAHDREAFQMIHGDLPTLEALTGVVAAVAGHRRAGSDHHPLNTLGAERAMRAWLVAHPEAIGASAVRTTVPPVPRPSLKDVAPCVAVATIDGVEHTVVCSQGVDLDVVPFAVDSRAATGIEPTLVVVRPRDLLPVQRLLGDAVRPAVQFATLPAG
jgi:hypothetical protein